LKSPWLDIPLTDYEGHMGAATVRQLQPLSAMFAQALEYCRPESVAILGVAGGNGLEHIDASVTERVCALDVNPAYLSAVRHRFPALGGLELHCVDLGSETVSISKVQMCHAALIFEHAGLGRCLDNALSLVADGGFLSVVLQLPSQTKQDICGTPFTSIQKLRGEFKLIDVGDFCQRITRKGFELALHSRHDLPGNKGFWMGIFKK
jgi:hypothetical protein